MVFFSRGETIRALKKHLVKLLPYTQDKDIPFSTKDYRLWALDSSITPEVFENYLITSLQKNDKEYAENISFLGVILDKFEYDLLGEIEDLITDKLLILEFKKPSHGYYNPKDLFIFKKDKINFAEKYVKQSFIDNYNNNNNVDAIGVTNYFTKIGLSSIGFYDDFNKFNSLTAEKRKEFEDNHMEGRNLFKIKDYFNLKYGICFGSSTNSKKFFDKIKSTPEFKKDLMEIFVAEIEHIKQNLHEIYEKQDIINKFGVLFSGGIVSVGATVNKKLNDEKVLSRYQQIMFLRKEKENKIYKKEEKTEIKTNNAIKQEQRKAEKKINLALKEEVKEEIVKIKCNYCSREIEEEEEKILCSLCNKIYYCSAVCLSKDSKFHKKKCK